MFTKAAREESWQLLSKADDRVARHVFVVLDGARAKRLPGHLVECQAEFACLLPSDHDEAAQTRAPYVARVLPGSRLWEWLGQSSWGQHWGIYALARAETNLDTVVRRLRECSRARLPDGRVVLFRFFDPRVWRPFFPTCDPAQLRLLFGPNEDIAAFACEDPENGALLIDTIEKGAGKVQPRRQRFVLHHD